MLGRISEALLARALPLLRCPSCRGPLTAGGDGLTCACGRPAPFRGGYFDFVGEGASVSKGERYFFRSLHARSYTASREGPVMRTMTGRTFAAEAEMITAGLSLKEDARVLDVPCGQANFTEAIARRAPGGLVLGVDLSPAMLELAAARLERAGIDNVVLLRASALDLPIADGAVDAVSNCGGLHLYPDVPRAITEMRRVLVGGGRLSGLTVRASRRPLVARTQRALLRLTGAYAFDFDALGAEFEARGFTGFRWQGATLIGWFTARAGA